MSGLGLRSDLVYVTDNGVGLCQMLFQRLCIFDFMAPIQADSTMAVIIWTNGHIMAGILRTNEHSHAYRPISAHWPGLPLTSPRSTVGYYGAKLNDLSMVGLIFDRLESITRLCACISNRRTIAYITLLSVVNLLGVGKLNLFFP